MNMLAENLDTWMMLIFGPHSFCFRWNYEEKPVTIVVKCLIFGRPRGLYGPQLLSSPDFRKVPTFGDPEPCVVSMHFRAA